ncbi:hypothetical protein [Alteromonas flava]|uniref:hypothetical protein n=1 Tax=Alteromonas flava TaxID=2048003 RepID=UPI000C2828ED|nr:hypothetical protein [Alteromonas flava]
MLKKVGAAVLLVTIFASQVQAITWTKQDTCKHWQELAYQHHASHQILIETKTEPQAIMLMKEWAQYQYYEPNSAGKILLDKIIQGLKSEQAVSELKTAVNDLCMTLSEQALQEEWANQDDINY